MVAMQSSRKKTGVLSPCCLMVQENCDDCVGFFSCPPASRERPFCGVDSRIRLESVVSHPATVRDAGHAVVVA